MNTRPLWSMPREDWIENAVAEMPPDANVVPRGEALPRSLGPGRLRRRVDPLVVALGSLALTGLGASIALASRDRARARSLRRARSVAGAGGAILAGIGVLPWLARGARKVRARRQLRRALSSIPAGEQGSFMLVEEIVASSASGT